MEQENRSNKLWHSAQSLDNISPNLIYEDKNPIPLDQQEKRQKITFKINNLVGSPTGVWSKSSNVIISYTPESFVIESTPNQKDSSNRHSPILTYGHFFDKERDEEDWIQEVIMGIDNFVRLIDRDLSSTTKEMIKEGLKEARKDLYKKKYQTNSLSLGKLVKASAVFSIVLVVPLLIGWILHEQVPQLLSHHQQLLLRLLKQNTQPDTLKVLQPVFQNPKVLQLVITWIAVLIAINNVILLGLAVLLTGMMKSGFKTTKK
jgi:hypothetical protein